MLTLSGTNSKFPVQPMDQVDQPPANNAMDRRDRTALDHFDKRPPLGIVEPRPFPRRLAVEQTVGTARIEAHHPVTHNLQAHPADPRGRTAAAADVNLGQCQQTARLIRALRSGRQSPQGCAVKIFPRPDR